MGLSGETVMCTQVDMDVGSHKGFENLSSEIDTLLEGAAPSSPMSAATDTSPVDDDTFDELNLTPETLEQWELDLDSFRTGRDRTHSFDVYGLPGVEDLVMTDDKMNMDSAAPEAPQSADFSGFDSLDIPENLMSPNGLFNLDFTDVKRATSSGSSAGVSKPPVAPTTVKPEPVMPTTVRVAAVPETLRQVRASVTAAKASGTTIKLTRPASLTKPATSIAKPTVTLPVRVNVKVERPVTATAAASGSGETAPKRIGIYTPEARKARIARFHAKRAKRVWRKRIKYDCRKKLADSRPRIKGRFVRREDMEEMMKDKKPLEAAVTTAPKVVDAAPRNWRLAGGVAKVM
mmetsp:Transcript_2036/g.6109  ORF Transcript_2036/g.6109 Transcript_2036/m.6109 type:complete len:347 (-) Transcript_2036:1857-2897(-)|eukprot:CAMPEP_0118878360 /NCGR_PEP_ID=MMETSP1163-20130328/18286_1 /TAXON_ID=124430 /ORGANISM="Phaeomonas parva, Strain CCMP2877" /LENGTH=346 /DNA_ID=CAMNT_0006814173 /DNA_START=558 /DNA_END=1598 /DNA_ORIENTATION=+